MRILYLDCFSGISGDMLIGALLNAGLSFNKLKKELSKLNIKDFTLEKVRTERSGISGIKFNVVTKNKVSFSKLKDIELLIQKSTLDNAVKKTAIEIFRNLAGAESRSHGVSVRNSHLHEVGEIDSIVDVVGAAIAINELKIDKIYASNLSVGRGKIKISHGVIPIPSPATITLLKEVPVRFTNIKKELITPTGAAILKTLASGFGEMPEMKIKKTGYGAGARDLKKQPNMLRAVIGEASPYVKDKISVLETNIDDMNPQIFDSLARRLFKVGALDVFLTPVFMKKFRPGILLTVLCKEELVEKLSSIIFKETTSIGIRTYKVKRNKLKRFTQKVRTKYGETRFKVSFAHDLTKIKPEHRDCERIARKTSIPLKKVYEELISDRR